MHTIVYLVLTWIRYFTYNMFTYSPQEKIINFKFGDQGRFNLICLLGNMYLLQLLGETNIFRQNKERLHIFILFKSFLAPALNACFFLLEHQ